MTRDCRPSLPLPESDAAAYLRDRYRLVCCGAQEGPVISPDVPYPDAELRAHSVRAPQH